MYDFSTPSGRDTDETINLLARMARFIVADITDARCIPQELKGFVESNPHIPVRPIIQEPAKEYGMFDHFGEYPWVLPVHRHTSAEQLIADVADKVLAPAEAKASEMATRRRQVEKEIARR